MDYKNKYLKYKSKYLELKYNQNGGNDKNDFNLLNYINVKINKKTKVINLSFTNKYPEFNTFTSLSIYDITNDIYYSLLSPTIGNKKKLGKNFYTKKQWNDMYKKNKFTFFLKNNVTQFKINTELKHSGEQYDIFLEKTFNINNFTGLKNINWVFTGFRDKDIENKIINLGGKVSNSISKNTHILVVKDSTVIDNPTSKVNKAKELGIKIIQKKDVDKFLK